MRWQWQVGSGHQWKKREREKEQLCPWKPKEEECTGVIQSKINGWKALSERMVIFQSAVK
jgi:hypothetical protein